MAQEGGPPQLPPLNKADIRLQLGLTTTLAALTTIVVLGRLAMRRFYIGKVELDDWILLVAWVFLAGYTGTQLGSIPTNYLVADDLENKTGYQHPDAVSLKLKLDYVLVILYYACVYLTKLSILCLYLRLCRSQSQFRYTSSGGRLRGLTWLTVIFTTLVFVPSVIVAICRCIPPSRVWAVTGDASDTGCVNRPAFFIATSVLHIVSDIIVAILPIPLVMKIRGPLMYKIGLAGVLMLGLVATAACTGRLVVLVEANRPGAFFYQYSTSVNTWSYAECSLGIIGASIPAWKPIFRKACQFLGAAGLTTGGCTLSPHEPSSQSRSLPYRIAAEGNKRRINDLHLDDGDNATPSSSKYDSRTNSSGRGSAQNPIQAPLAAKLQMSRCQNAA